MSEPSRTTVYYNSACPVCNAGIRSQRSRMQGCEVQWVDVHRDNEAVQPLGADLEQVRERLHVKDENGRLVVGVQALAQLWLQTPGQRWLGRLVQLPVLSGLAALTYNLFARLLYRWNRRRGSW
jgi:predicted DCC family thiol-disulfide oxidoreductase YuxK